MYSDGVPTWFSYLLRAIAAGAIYLVLAVSTLILVAVFTKNIRDSILTNVRTGRNWWTGKKRR